MSYNGFTNNPQINQVKIFSNDSYNNELDFDIDSEDNTEEFIYHKFCPYLGFIYD